MFSSQFIRYVVVGVYNTALGYLLYSFLLFILDNYTLAYFIAYLLVSIKSYLLYKKYVFKTTSKESKYLLFGLGHLIQYLMGTILLLLFVGGLGVDEYLAGFYILPFSVLFSFIYNRFIFTK